MDQDLTQFAVIILFTDSAGCDEIILPQKQTQ